MTATITGASEGGHYGGSGTIPLPAGVAVGDVLVLALRAQANGWTSPWVLPAGWSWIGPAWEAKSSRRANAIAGAVADEELITSGQITVTSTHSRHAWVLVAVRGVTLDGVLPSTSYAGVTSGQDVTVAMPTLPTASLIVAMAGSEFSAGTSAATSALPGSLTEAGRHTLTEAAGGQTAIWVGVGERTAGAVPDMTLTWASWPSGPAAQAVALPLVGGPSAGPGLAVQRMTEAGPVEARLYVATADGPATPSETLVVPAGYPSVQSMLDGGEFWWAHRGGGVIWPEMSLHGYTQAVMRGFGALEVSLARTRDGVWIGLHDDTLDRAAGVTGGLRPGDLTWAEVQDLQIILGQRGAPQPFMRLEEVLDAYAASHVLIIDPKHDGAHDAEVYAMLAEHRERVIIKGYYTGGATLAVRARDAGFATWGFLYDSNLTGDPTWQDRLEGWSLLGLNWDATQADWDAVLALGRPVVAHICATESAVTQARSKGAHGFQCSGVLAITPHTPTTSQEAS